MNPKCRAVLSGCQWGEGYCSPGCEMECSDGMPLRDMMHGARGSPDVAAQLRANADLCDAMNEALAIDAGLPRRLLGYTHDPGRLIAFVDAARIDARLPEIIYQRTKRQTYAEIGASMGIDASTCNRIVARATRNVLRRCGLLNF